MPDRVRLIDNKVKDEVLRYPLVEIIRKLFPDVRVRGRSVLCNPLRDDKHPSLSCFRDYSGYQRWKDHATGESGDNLDFYRLVYPEYGYVEALDRLSFLVLGRSVLADYVPGHSVPFYSEARRVARVHRKEVEDVPALSILSEERYDVSSTPSALVSYVRGRGISDEVGQAFLSYVVYENRNRKGKPLMDSVSGLPVVDASGRILTDPARYEALGMRNDIGGFSLRVPGNGKDAGFKGSNVSFISTFLSCGSGDGRCVSPVSFEGDGEGFVSQFLYDGGRRFLSVNPTQGFSGVEPWAAPAAMVFLDRWIGRYLEGRELKCATAVLGSLNGPLSREVDVVEGMFDALSDIEFERLAGRSARPGRDLVVLNSISNLHWAVPFLSMHGVVRSLLDNDMRSSAGKKAYDLLCAEVESFSGRLGVECSVRSDSGIFYPCKDINDFLKLKKGFVQMESVAAMSSVITAPSGKSRRCKTNSQFKP